MEDLYNDLPVKEMFVNDIYAMGIVERAANLRDDIILFSNEDETILNGIPLLFKSDDMDKQVITGIAMVPNLKIYRRSPEPHYVWFSEETIKEAALSFFKNHHQNTTTLNHEVNVNGNTVFESWFVEDPKMDKTKVLGFKDVEKGSWVISMKVENKEIWDNYIKTGILKGFSIEMDPAKFAEETFNDYPEAAKNNAKKAIEWRDKYPDEINGGTAVGWTRANQLANGENLSYDTVKRMKAFFDRHDGNQTVSAENKETPWKDAGYVAWLLWGGDEAYRWAIRVINRVEKNSKQFNKNNEEKMTLKNILNFFSGKQVEEFEDQTEVADVALFALDFIMGESKVAVDESWIATIDGEIAPEGEITVSTPDKAADFMLEVGMEGKVLKITTPWGIQSEVVEDVAEETTDVVEEEVMNEEETPVNNFSAEYDQAKLEIEKLKLEIEAMKMKSDEPLNIKSKNDKWVEEKKDSKPNLKNIINGIKTKK